MGGVGVVTNPAARRANETACPLAPVTIPNAVCNKVQNITAGKNVVLRVARIWLAPSFHS